MEQKVIITKKANDVNTLLEQGWKIIYVIAQHIDVIGSSYSCEFGNFCFVLERKITE